MMDGGMKMHWRGIGCAVTVALAVVLQAVTVCAAGPSSPFDYPNAWPLAEVVRTHPRLFFNAERLQRFKSRWNDPQYAKVVGWYAGGKEPLSLALTALATDDPKTAKAAADAALALPYRVAGLNAAGYCDPKTLVFDWCYALLDTGTREALAKRISEGIDRREADITARNSPVHESHYTGLQAYLSDVLALEGEAGMPSRLRKAQNLLQHWMETADEGYGDGLSKFYAYQDVSMVTPPCLFATATNTDFFARYAYAAHRADVLLRQLSADGTGFIQQPGDQATNERGFLLQTPASVGPFMIAEMRRDALAQFLGEKMLARQGLDGNNTIPFWLLLLFRDESVKAAGPQELGVPPVELFKTSGTVNFRSGWEQVESGGTDLSAWFYAGPRTAHARPDAGHFVLWRGDDNLICNGSNYFGYTSGPHFWDWETQSISRNTVLFSPKGAARPDREGCQIQDPPVAASVAHYPASARGKVWAHFGPIGYQGEITSFKDSPVATVVVADITAAYDPQHVRRYTRTMVYVKPYVFLIRDAYDLEDVERVRMVLHYRGQPVAEGLAVKAGSDKAGILEGPAGPLLVQRGQSRTRVQLLSPAGATLRLVGGGGFEAYVDGQNIPLSKEAWILRHPEFGPTAAGYLNGQWRSEFETEPKNGGGEILVAIAAGSREGTLPEVVLENRDSGAIVVVKRGQATVRVAMGGRAGIPAVMP
jgi:hypothetical protein